MDRQEAEQALGIIRKVIQETREDLVAHNWGAIWIVHSFTNAAAVSAGWYIERQGLGVFWYLAPLAVVAIANLVIVLVLAQRDQGVRSYVEWQLHGIWVTFIVFSIAAAAMVQASGASPTLFCPLFAMTSGIGFAMMGVVFYRHFFVFALLCLGVMLVAPLIPVAGWQWVLVGLVWWSAMFIPGVVMLREKRKREQAAGGTRIL